MMSEATHKLEYSACLDGPIRKIDLVDVFVTDDCCAHQFDIALYCKNKPATLSSAAKVNGYFIRHSDKTTTLISGSITDNVASVLLDKPCYTKSGRFSLIIKIIENNVISTVFYAEGSIRTGSTEKYIDPDDMVPSLDDLLAQIADMEAATADGRAAAQEARTAGNEAVALASTAGTQAQETANAAADDATAAAETARATIYTRAMAIPDESALATSHELHAQRDYPLNVTVHGYTIQEGEGDPSPENVRPIHGLDAAQVRAGGRNLFDIRKIYQSFITNENTITLPRRGYIVDIYTGQNMSSPDVPTEYLNNLPRIPAGNYALIYDIQTDDTNKNISIYTVDEYGKTIQAAHGGSYDGSGRTVTINSPTRITLRYMGNSETTITNLMLIQSGSTATPYEPYLATTADLPLLPDNSPLMEGDTVENWVASGCDCRVTFDGSEDENWACTASDSANVRDIFAIGDGLPGRNPGEVMDASYRTSDMYADRIAIDIANQNYLPNSMTGRGSSYDDAFYIYAPFGMFAGDDAASRVSAFRDYLAANPLTVYYRSTDYTPEKELRVCRVVRRFLTEEFDGSEGWALSTYGDNTMFYISRPNAKSKYNGGVHYSNMYAFGVGTLTDKTFGISSQLYIKDDDYATTQEFTDALAAKAAAGEPLVVTYELVTPETYMTDPLPLLPPAALESETVTVTASGESRVEYAHDTKHFIIDFVTKALASQS